MPNQISNTPPSPEFCPDWTYESGRYVVRFAKTARELEQILRLRFEVFNLEMGEGLAESESTGLDRDAFDAYCHHLMIEEKSTGHIIGTYRMQTGEMAEQGIGFYTADEFDLKQFPSDVFSLSAETGRACIARSHRNGRILFLLWRGLMAYLINNKKRYVFGCCSIASQDPEEGLAAHDYLREKGHLDPVVQVPTMPDYRCELDDGMLRTHPTVQIPQLMKIYLGYNATICSPPAIDRAFKTIDFLTLIDIEKFDKKTYRNLST